MTVSLARSLALTAFCVAVAACIPPAAGAEDVARLAREIAAPWPALQRSDGSYYDYLKPFGGTRYSESMLGLALLQVGVREGDDRLIDSGLRGVEFAIAHGDRQLVDPSVFETFALAAAYNAARGPLAGDPRFERLRPTWEEWLRKARPAFLARRPRSFYNKQLVEACAWLELAGTGLRSAEPGAVLADPEGSARRAIDYVNREVPRLTSRSRGVVWGRRIRLLADPPPAPLAYHALSLGLLARAVERLGALASPAARTALAEAAWGTWGIMGPDGDVAYTGRSQDHVWALAFTAYGSVAAMAPGDPAGAELHAVAERALGRLRARHPLTPLGIAIAPALAPSNARFAAAMDVYADAAAYAGLTVAALDWLARRGGIGAPVSGGPAGDRPGAGVVHAPGAGLGVLRSGPVWLAVRSAPDRRHGDLRSDFGLVALKRQTATGWEDVLQARPLRRDRAGAGPIRLEGTQRLAPIGKTIAAGLGGIRVTGTFAAPGEVVTAAGVRGSVARRPAAEPPQPGARRPGFRLARRRSAGQHRLALTVAPLMCGARLSWPAPSRTRHELSVFFAPPFELVPGGPNEFTAGGQLVRASDRLMVAVEHGYASASAPDLARARLRFRHKRGGTAAITIQSASCAAGADR